MLVGRGRVDEVVIGAAGAVRQAARRRSGAQRAWTAAGSKRRRAQLPPPRRTQPSSVGVLVDEADADAVVRAATRRALHSSRAGSRSVDAARRVSCGPRRTRDTVCDLVGERRDRILRLVEAFHRNQVLGRVRTGS